MAHHQPRLTKRHQGEAAIAPFVNRHNARSWRFALDRDAFVTLLLREAGAFEGQRRLLSNLLQELAGA